jgi:hypothetical protein
MVKYMRLCPDPTCQTPHSNVPRVLACWMTHRPRLRDELPLSSIADALGVTPGRVSQSFSALGFRAPKSPTPREPR